MSVVVIEIPKRTLAGEWKLVVTKDTPDRWIASKYDSFYEISDAETEFRLDVIRPWKESE